MSRRTREAGSARAATDEQSRRPFAQEARSAELQRAVELIREKARDGSAKTDCADELCRALRLVADLKEKSALRDVIRLAKSRWRSPEYHDESVQILGETAKTLWMLGDPHLARKMLVRLLNIRGDNEKVLSVKLNAAFALHVLRCKKVVKHLKKILKTPIDTEKQHEQRDLHRLPVSALFRINTRSALLALAECCADEKTHDVVEETLISFKDTDYLEEMQRCGKVFVEHYWALQWVRGSSEESERLLRVIRAFADEEDMQKIHAFKEIGCAQRDIEWPIKNKFFDLESKEGRMTWLAAINHPDRRISRSALRERIERMPTHSFGRLKQLFYREPKYRRQCASLIGTIRLPEALIMLLELSRSKNAERRTAAACGLSRAAVWSDEATTKLVALLDDEDADIRIIAMQHISRLCLPDVEDKLISRIISGVISAGEVETGSDHVHPAKIIEEGRVASVCIVRLAEKHTSRVKDALTKAYNQTSNLAVKKHFFDLLTEVHKHWLASQKGTEHSSHQVKPWGCEDFEILNERKGLTRLHMNARMRVRDLTVKLNEESDLSHHFIGEGEEREFCHSTSFHFHATKDVTIVVNSGQIKIVYDHDKKEAILSTGTRSSMDLPAGMPHQIINIGDVEAQVLEFEFPPCKDDIRRLEDPYARKGVGYAVS